MGVGSYRIDLHPSSGGDNYIDVSSALQIPLGPFTGAWRICFPLQEPA